MKHACVVALLPILAPTAAADVTVRAIPGFVSIEVRTAPLSAVLDVLARQTGMKVVYDGPAPSQLVTVSLSGPCLREAVPRLLEGQGLNYALAGDDTGVRILVLTTRTTATGERNAAEDDEGDIPAALRPLLPAPAEPTGEGIPAPLRALMAERDRAATVTAPRP